MGVDAGLGVGGSVSVGRLASGTRTPGGLERSAGQRLGVVELTSRGRPVRILFESRPQN